MKKYKTSVAFTSAELGDEPYKFTGELTIPIRIMYDNKENRGTFNIRGNETTFDFTIDNDEIVYSGKVTIKRKVLEKVLVAVLEAVINK